MSRPFCGLGRLYAFLYLYSFLKNVDPLIHEFVAFALLLDNRPAKAVGTRVNTQNFLHITVCF